MKHFDGRRLLDILAMELRRREVCEQSAGHVANSLVETSLRGVDSHGINLFPYYVTAVEGGRINPSPKLRIVKRRRSAATLDADHGFGHHAGSVAIAHAIEMAGDCGVGAVAVGNSSHFGAAAYFAQQAARQGYAAFAFTNADALVRVFGGRDTFFGTNPICFCAPMEGEEPFCLDMATSRVSWNKVMNKRRSGEAMPRGWACDGEGRSTTDPAAARMLESAGEYKGFGLGMMIEILCALLAEGPIGKDLLPMYGSPLSARRSISHFFVVFNVGDFVDPGIFRQRLKSLVSRVRSLHAEGDGTVMVPGDPEKHAFAVRTRQGIPVEADKYTEFLAISPEFGKALVE